MIILGLIIFHYQSTTLQQGLEMVLHIGNAALLAAIPKRKGPVEDTL